MSERHDGDGTGDDDERRTTKTNIRAPAQWRRRWPRPGRYRGVGGGRGRPARDLREGGGEGTSTSERAGITSGRERADADGDCTHQVLTFAATTRTAAATKGDRRGTAVSAAAADRAAAGGGGGGSLSSTMDDIMVDRVATIQFNNDARDPALQELFLHVTMELELHFYFTTSVLITPV